MSRDASRTPTDVTALPRRVAHATYALIEASRELNMPVTASEVVVYDEEALTARHTAAALREARRFGLAALAGRHWFPTFPALDLRSQFEERYLADTEGPEDR